MATLLLAGPNIVVSAPLSDRKRSWNPLLHPPHTHYRTFSHSNQFQFLRGSLSVARFGFRPGYLPEPDGAGELLRELFGRAEGLIYTIADAAVSSSDTVATTTKLSNDWLSGITSYMESVLKVLKDGLSTLHVPYAYGFAIILLTVLVKAATFPLTKKQVESAMAMRSLQPQIKAIQQRYAGNQERIQLETARLYKLAGINPLAGCLPTLATIPVWIGLYRALSNVADEGLLTEGFFWIPSLAGPTTIAARQNGSGISWLFPFVDGHPPLGWSDTLAYLVLPLLLVVSQYISVQIMQSTQANDPNMKSSQAITKLLPLMIGYFALSVPSGLSLYWLTNNILSTAQQVWLQKLGGAQNPVGQIHDDNHDIMKVDPMPFQKSVSELNPTKKEAREGEKLTSDRPRPGERFKQIKEQEARRRQQKEEGNRKAEMTAAKGTDASDAHEKSVQGEGNVAEGGFIDGKPQAINANNNPNTSAVVANGQTSDLERNWNATSTSERENNEASARFQTDGKSEKHSNESIEKGTVELYTNTATTDNSLPGEDPQHVTKD